MINDWDNGQIGTMFGNYFSAFANNLPPIQDLSLSPSAEFDISLFNLIFIFVTVFGKLLFYNVNTSALLIPVPISSSLKRSA